MAEPSLDARNKARLEHLRQQVQEGLDQLDRGDGIPADAAFAELRRRLAKRVAADRH